MNTKLAERLNEAIEKYNANEEVGLSWWEVLDEIGDVYDDKKVLDTIRSIELAAGMRQKSVLIYARGNDPDAVIDQIKKGSEYAVENGMYVSAVVTKLEEFQAAVEMMDLDAVIVRDYSRISRKAIDQLQTVFVLQQLGIELHVIGE